MITLICPNCMKSVAVPEDSAGQPVTCPSCQHTFLAPTRYTPVVLTEPSPADGPPENPEPVLSPGLGRSSEPPGTPEPHTPRDPTEPPTPSPTIASAPESFQTPTQEPTVMTPEVPPEPPPGYVPPPPPGYVPPPKALANVVSAASATPASPPEGEPPWPAGYTRSCGITISPRVVAWMPAVLLTVTFVSTFFPWVGSYLGGYPVYSQSPWRAIFGSVSRNFALEERMSGDRSWLDKLRSDWELILPYVLLLLASLVVAWAERGLPALDLRQFPPLAKMWPWRKAIVAGVAGLAFLLMFVHVSRGFGMERAIRTMVRENPELAKLREEAGASEAKLALVENKEEQELARYNLEHTFWLRLGLWCNLFASLTALLSIGLDRRGDKPPPKLLLHY